MTTDCFRIAVLAVALAVAACSRTPTQPAASTPNRATTPAPGAIAAWPLPTTHAQQPDLAVAPDGSLLLSWIESEGDRQQLRMARWRGGRWSTPVAIAAGEGIGNGADTPHVRQTADGTLWATWLHKLGEGHARDIVLARSTDDGRTWSTPIPVNTDGTATEHGFASLWAVGRDALGIAWLDGRETGGGAHGHAAPATAGMHHDDMPAMAGMSHREEAAAEPTHATMLRTAVFYGDLQRRDESALDTATCDCCQTDVAVTTDGPRLVYRDRAPGEVRDIAILARSEAGWSAPRLVHADSWRMPACPVNGPAIASAGNDMVVAWYTMRDGVPVVRAAHSGDGGVHFGEPVDLASSPDVLGRVDVALDARGAWVTWLTGSANGQALHVAHLPPWAAKSDRALDVATLAAHGRGSGWPHLVATADGMRIVWTDVVDGVPVLHGAVVATR